MLTVTIMDAEQTHLWYLFVHYFFWYFGCSVLITCPAGILASSMGAVDSCRCRRLPVNVEGIFMGEAVLASCSLQFRPYIHPIALIRLFFVQAALDSDDLLYLKEQMEAEEDAERLLRRTEKRAFAAFKISLGAWKINTPVSFKIKILIWEINKNYWFSSSHLTYSLLFCAFQNLFL